jgi:hypothetical protein
MLINVSQVPTTINTYNLTLSQDEIAALSNHLNNPCGNIHPVDQAHVDNINAQIATAMQSVEPPQVP